MSGEALKICLIAGEASGDRLGAGLILGLRSIYDGELVVTGVGGPQMEAEGLRSLFAMDELSVMGLAEIIPRIPVLRRRIRQTIKHVLDSRPDMLICIDSPGFTKRVAKAVKRVRPNLPVVHYVAPSVWAWRPARAKKMAAFTDHVLAVLPFEPDYMRAAGMSCDFVGHPIVTTAQATPKAQDELAKKLHIDRQAPVLTILPGSRHSEISRLLPEFANIVARLKILHPDMQIVMPAVGHLADEIASHTAGWAIIPHLIKPEGLGIRQFEQAKMAAFAMSDAALAASGTVSLELARQQCPHVIAYRTNWLTAAIVRRLLRVDSVTLVNLLVKEKAVPEFLQEGLRADRVVAAVEELLSNGNMVSRQKQAFQTSMMLLGAGDTPPSIRAAQSCLTFLATYNAARITD